MSFLQTLTHKQKNHKQKKSTDRKEKQDSLKVIQHPLSHFISKERASAFTSGSITLEAAIVIPIFFFAILCLASLLEFMAVQTTMRNAIYSTGKQLAEKMYTEPMITPSEVEKCIIETVGVKAIDNSIIAGGLEGIDCSGSMADWSTGVMNLSLQYRVNIPVLIFQIAPIVQKETIRVKGWSGFAAGAEGAKEEKTVYITETGLVYHKDSECTYLDLSIRQVSAPELENLRNHSGGKYYACESCGKKNTGRWILYVTDYGTRYHTSLECKKLQRKVYAISIDEAYGLGGCSKCVK